MRVGLKVSWLLENGLFDSAMKQLGREWVGSFGEW